MLATSGIEDVVRIWAPTLGMGSRQPEERLIGQVEGNQRRMSLSPQLLGRVLPLRRLLMGSRPHLLALLLAHAAEEE